METRKWKHKITGGITGVILSFIMLAGFSYLTYWFSVTQSGAILIGRIVVLFAALAFALALYRAVFFKVLIHRDGFFFQTAPGNGRYFRHYEIRRIWVSSGRESTASQAAYCHFETAGGEILRFSYTGADTDAVQYLIKRVKAADRTGTPALHDDGREHIVSGKVQGLQRVAVVLFLFAVVLILTRSLAGRSFPLIAYMLPGIFAAAAVLLELNRYFFYEIRIQADGFYFRTSPFHSSYFAYTDITSCKLAEKRKKFGSVYRKGIRETHFFYFLLFTDRENTRHRLLYNKALFEQEMQVLAARIRRAQGNASPDQSSC